jgi:hypothetical protein
LLQFRAEPRRAYRIEYSDGLSSGTWRTLSDLPADNAVRQVRFPDPTPFEQRPTRFYRVIIP